MDGKLQSAIVTLAAAGRAEDMARRDRDKIERRLKLAGVERCRAEQEVENALESLIADAGANGEAAKKPRKR